MVKTYDELYHEVVRRAGLENSAVASIDSKVIAERISKITAQEVAAERNRERKKKLEAAFCCSYSR